MPLLSVVITEGIKETMYLSIVPLLRSELESPTISMFEDSKGAKRLAENLSSSSNSKYIDVRHHFLPELVANGDITVNSIPGKEQCAGIFAKALDRSRFEMHRDCLLGMSTESSRWFACVPEYQMFCCRWYQRQRRVFVRYIRFPATTKLA